MLEGWGQLRGLEKGVGSKTGLEKHSPTWVTKYGVPEQKQSKEGALWKDSLARDSLKNSVRD